VGSRGDEEEGLTIRRAVHAGESCLHLSLHHSLAGVPHSMSGRSWSLSAFDLLEARCFFRGC